LGDGPVNGEKGIKTTCQADTNGWFFLLEIKRLGKIEEKW
jgi:hypothetical protein